MSRSTQGTTDASVLTVLSSPFDRQQLNPAHSLALIIKEFVFIVGVIFHEVAHWLGCLAFGLEDYDAVYFNVYLRDEGISGYIDFQTPRTFFESFIIHTMPFFFNTFVATILFLWLAVNDVFVLSLAEASVLEWLVFWVALSISAKSIPSIPDLEAIGMYEEGDRELHELQYVLCLPLITPLRVLSRFPIYFLDVVYALAFGYVITALI